MALTRYRLAQLLGLLALPLALPACSTPVRAPSTIPAPPQPAPRAVLLPPQPLPPQPAESPELKQVNHEAPALGLEPSCLLPPVPVWVPGPSSWDDSHKSDEGSEGRSVFWERLDRDIAVSLQDYRNFYSWPNLGLVGLGVAGAAPLANTSADRDIRRWYQDRYRGRVRSLAEVFNYGGQIWVALPIGLELAALCGKAPENYATDGGWYEWSNRSLRAIAVGFPPVVAMYGLLGASRPDRNDSAWHPFNDIHGVSGHTFVGAVPFLTAASMTDNVWLKVPLVAGSFLTGWARFHEDRHYFSQIALGWWMAYLSVRTVNQTEQQRRGWSLAPLVSPDCAGVGVHLRY
jgi:hypothetical protein